MKPKYWALFILWWCYNCYTRRYTKEDGDQRYTKECMDIGDTKEGRDPGYTKAGGDERYTKEGETQETPVQTSSVSLKVVFYRPKGCLPWVRRRQPEGCLPTG